MKDLKLIVPHTIDSLIGGYEQDLLISVAVDPDWIVSWTFRHWDLVAEGDRSLELYDVLFDVLVCQLDGLDLDSTGYRQRYSIIEENSDQLVNITQDIRKKLYPYIGDLPLGAPEVILMGVDHERHSKESMLVSFALDSPR